MLGDIMAVGFGDDRMLYDDLAEEGNNKRWSVVGRQRREQRWLRVHPNTST